MNYVPSFQAHLDSAVTISVGKTEREFHHLAELDPCKRYWFVVTAVYCETIVSSTPLLLDFHQPKHFTIELLLLNESCYEWINTNSSEKLNDVKSEILSTLSGSEQCIAAAKGNFCIADSKWTCAELDDSVIFE